MHTVIDTSDARFQQHWHKLLNNDPLRNPLYESIWGRSAGFEQDSGHSANGSHYTDRSFMVISEGEPVFGCSLTLHVDEHGRKRLGYFGLDACTHVNRTSLNNPSNNFCPEAIRLLQQHIDQLLDEEKPEAIDYLDPVSCGIMSPVTQVLLEKGAIPTVQQIQLIDLEQPLAQLKSQIHESYREAIEWGNQHLSIKIIQRGLEEDGFGGTESYSSSYDEQGRTLESCVYLLNQGQGFLVQAEYEGALVASALFVYSERTCQCVFADLLSDTVKDLEGKPILHSVLWRAVMQAKGLGCVQFDFGNQNQAAVALDSNQLSPGMFGGLAHTRLKVSLMQGSAVPPLDCFS
ncbi:MAG: hypothetical protein MI746_01915 [Pseudomonadales bacterium]|nr:hypothetical protein [Pseudomonadales bacterium]